MFGEMIRDARKSAGFTLDFASKNIGISMGYLSDLEHGRALRPKMKILYAMSGLYGIGIDEICITAERVPQDVFYKIIRCPELMEVIRNHKEA